MKRSKSVKTESQDIASNFTALKLKVKTFDLIALKLKVKMCYHF